MLFSDGQFSRNAVSGASRGKHELLDAAVAHGIQKSQRVRYVILKIFAGLDGRFAHVRVRGKMNHGFDAVLGNYLSDQRPIPNIAANEWTPSDRTVVPGDQIIEHDGLAPCARQRFGRVTPYIPGSSGDQYVSHFRPP